MSFWFGRINIPGVSSIILYIGHQIILIWFFSSWLEIFPDQTFDTEASDTAKLYYCWSFWTPFLSTIKFSTETACNRAGTETLRVLQRSKINLIKHFVDGPKLCTYCIHFLKALYFWSDKYFPWVVPQRLVIGHLLPPLPYWLHQEIYYISIHIWPQL